MNTAEQLEKWVKLKHSGQLIRCTDEPYFNHLIAVAEMAGPAITLGYEIGLCHDLLEDTSTSAGELREVLISMSYTVSEARYITASVVELTDVYTSTVYPALSKKVRKEKEAARWLTISASAQTVKYCDLIYNINWVLQHDRKNAKAYLKKKQRLLTGMVGGDKELHQNAIEAVRIGLETLSDRTF